MGGGGSYIFPHLRYADRYMQNSPPYRRNNYVLLHVTFECTENVTLPESTMLFDAANVIAFKKDIKGNSEKIHKINK